VFKEPLIFSLFKSELVVPIPSEPKIEPPLIDK
jgi:hypothetical protein